MTRAVLIALLALACGDESHSAGFVYGPLVGDTTPTTAILWSRLAEAGTVVVRYGTREDLDGALVSSPVAARPEADFTVRVPLFGLTPATRYWYRFELAGHALTSAPYPSFRTAPAGGAAFTVAVGSCARFPAQPIFDVILAEAPDLFLMIGDAHYADTTDLGLLRAAYQTSRAVPELVRLVSRTPTWAVWDDHDFAGDDTDGNVPGKENALRAFAEYWANPAAGSDGVDGVWFSFTWGGVEFFMLDGRYWRNVGGRTMLGATQLAWLEAGLVASTARFKVIVSGSVFNPGGTPDGWRTYQDERDRIFRHVMGHGIGGVVLVSGDRHHAEVWRLQVDGGYPLHELVASGFAVGSAACDGDFPERLVCATDDNFFGLLHVRTDVTPAELAIEVRGSSGAVVHRLDLREDELQAR